MILVVVLKLQVDVVVIIGSFTCVLCPVFNVLDLAYCRVILCVVRAWHKSQRLDPQPGS